MGIRVLWLIWERPWRRSGFNGSCQENAIMADNKRSSDHNNRARDSKTCKNVEPSRTAPQTERGLIHSPYFNGPLYERMSEDLHLTDTQVADARKVIDELLLWPR